jgi:hypothetical protein
MTGRTALITEIIAPYRIPVFNELCRQLGGELDVFFIARSEGRRTWPIYEQEIRFPYHVLGGLQFSLQLRGDVQPVYLAPPILPRLLRGRYSSVVVGGWNHLEC